MKTWQKISGSQHVSCAIRTIIPVKASPIFNKDRLFSYNFCRAKQFFLGRKPAVRTPKPAAHRNTATIRRIDGDTTNIPYRSAAAVQPQIRSARIQSGTNPHCARIRNRPNPKCSNTNCYESELVQIATARIHNARISSGTNPKWYKSEMPESEVAELAKSELRETAKNSNETPRVLYNVLKSRYDAEVIMRAGGNSFLLHEKVMNQGKVIVFASESGLEILAKSNIILADGTFDVTPDGFCQIFTIHAYISESVIRPVVFALLPSKELSAYDAVLSAICSNPILMNWKPQLVISEFIAYLEKYYINGVGSNPAAFPPDSWTCAEVTRNAIHRTTNALEVWHRMLKPVIHQTNGLRKIRLSDLIEKLKEEESRTDSDAKALSLNPNYKVSSNRRMSNVAKDQRLLRAIRNTPAPPNLPLTGLSYLKSISLALKS
uniref:MULE transposase domain-containing protein n=1 Tax=Caenorhabditis japonica TaxID=281687 RepID=A0A8R1EV16_CAEJA